MDQRAMSSSSFAGNSKSSVTDALGTVIGIGKKVYRWYEDNSELVDTIAGNVRDVIREKVLRPSIPTPDPVCPAELKQFALNKRHDARERAIIRELTELEANELVVAHGVNVLGNREAREATHLSAMENKLTQYKQTNAELIAKLVQGEGALVQDERNLLNGLRSLGDQMKLMMQSDFNFETNVYKHELLESAHNVSRDLISSIPTIGSFINAGIDMGRTAYKVLDRPVMHHMPETIQKIYIDGSQNLAQRVFHDVAATWLERKKDQYRAMDLDESSPVFDIDHYESEKIIMSSVEKELTEMLRAHKMCLKAVDESGSSSRVLLHMLGLYCYTPLLSHGEVFMLVMVTFSRVYRYHILAIDLVDEIALYRSMESEPGLGKKEALDRVYNELKTRSPYGETARKIYSHPLSCVGMISTITHPDRVILNMKYVSQFLGRSLIGTVADCRRSILERVMWGVLCP